MFGIVWSIFKDLGTYLLANGFFLLQTIIAKLAFKNELPVNL